MKKKQLTDSMIAPLTPDNLQIKLIHKLELVKGRSYLLLFKVGTIPFDQAQKLAGMLAEAGYKCLFVAVQDTDGIKVVEREEQPTKALEAVKTSKTFRKKMVN